MFLQRVTSGTSNQQILQQVARDFTMSNEQLMNFQRISSKFSKE